MPQRPLTPRGREIRAALARLDRGEATLDAITAELGVKPSTLVWWRSQLRRHGVDGETPSFVELKVDTPMRPTSLVVEVGALRVVVALDFDEEHLVRAIRALQRC